MNYQVNTAARWIPTPHKITHVLDQQEPSVEKREPAVNAASSQTSEDAREITNTRAVTPNSTNDFQINWWMLYLMISVLLLIRFLSALRSVIRLNRQASFDHVSGIHFLTSEKIIGASFFNRIFISSKYQNSEPAEVIIAHEQVHARKWHSLDILVSELILCVFWYNPIFWIIRHEIRLNHEYEVDLEMSGRFGAQDYSQVLLSLASRHLTVNRLPLNSFSFAHTRKRIDKLHNPQKTYWGSLAFLIPFLLLATWIAGCDTTNTTAFPETLVYNGEPIREITTTFVSHQNDTENKDMKTVAVARFLPDGSLDEVIQHMTYPYNYENPFRVSLWGQTDANAVPVILDGLELDIAEYNLLYGNDWPAKYQHSFENGHPKFSVGYEGTEYSKSITTAGANLPERIVVDASYQSYNNLFTIKSSFIEEFTYEDNKVESYHHHGEQDNSEINKYLRPGQQSRPSKSVHNSKDYSFQYSGELLTQVSDGKITYEFEYDDSRLVASKFFNNGKLYNTRKYYYADNGLKERTEIFNVYGDPEYSIHYNYEFY